MFTDVEECVKEADVIVAATSTTEPILKECSMNPWVHINCKTFFLLHLTCFDDFKCLAVGAPRPQLQELSNELMKNSVVYVDSTLSASNESGDVINSGVEIYGEIGEVLAGNKKAEKSQRTIFKSLGIIYLLCLYSSRSHDFFLQGWP